MAGLPAEQFTARESLDGRGQIKCLWCGWTMGYAWEWIAKVTAIEAAEKEHTTCPKQPWGGFDAAGPSGSGG